MLKTYTNKSIVDRGYIRVLEIVSKKKRFSTIYFFMCHTVESPLRKQSKKGACIRSFNIIHYTSIVIYNHEIM